MKIKDRLKNKKNLVSIILMVIALIAIGGITYASFNINLEGLTNIKAVTPSISLTYGEAPNPLEQTNKMLTDEEYKTSSDYFEFKVISSSNIVYDLYYNIYLTEKENNTLSKDNLYIYLTLVEDNSEILVKGPIKVSDLTNYTKYDNSYIIKSDSFSFLNNKEETKERIYRLRIWNKGTSTDVNVNISGGIYEYTVNVDTYLPITSSIKEQVKTMNISYKYKNDANVTYNGTIYNSGDNGVFLYNGTDDNGGTYPVYYYRGNVDNNNVLFGGYCWKVVRTTSTGGTKLIYNGVPSSDGTCNNTGDNTEIGSVKFNTNGSSPADVGYMYGTRYERTSKYMDNVSDTILLGKNVTYDNGSYTLTDTTSIVGSEWADKKETLYSYRYTCLNSTGTCEKVNFIIYFGGYPNYESLMLYLTFENGDTVDEAVEKMFDINPNQTSSSIKNEIDNWYQENLVKYSDMLENTIFCNDRVLYSGSMIKEENAHSYFEPVRRTLNYNPSLTCSRTLDSFSLSIDSGGIEGYGNNALTYPVGLLTSDEVMLAAGVWNTENTNYYLYTGNTYYTMSPAGIYVGNYACVFYVTSDYASPAFGSGLLNYGIRPSLSLKRGVQILSGDGTINNPYVVI